MTLRALPSTTRLGLNPLRGRAIVRPLLVPVTIAMLMISGPLAPCPCGAAEDAPGSAASEGNASAGARSAGTAWHFTKDGAKEVVVTPEQKARQAARKAKRKQRHAAEKAAAATKPASDAGKPPAAAPAQTPGAAPKEVPPGDKSGAAKAGDNVNGAGGAK